MVGDEARVGEAFSAGYKGGGSSGNEVLDLTVGEAFRRGVNCGAKLDDLDTSLAVGFRAGLDLAALVRAALSGSPESVWAGSSAEPPQDEEDSTDPIEEIVD